MMTLSGHSWQRTESKEWLEEDKKGNAADQIERPTTYLNIFLFSFWNHLNLDEGVLS